MNTSLRIAFQFLTRIPVSTPNEITDEQQGASLLFYPVVGAFIGMVLFGILYFINPVSNIIAAAVTLTVWVLITGGLHIDGLADSADAWLGATKMTKELTKARSFEIMKDPSCGPAGVFWIVLILILKFAALTEINSENMFVIFTIPVIGRSIAVLLFLTTPYVSENGIASRLVDNIPRTQAYTVLLLVLLLLFFINTVSIVAVFAAIVVMSFLRSIMISRLDGMTGDTTGALIEISESVSLIMFILFL